jgi:hypothetical protein
MFGAPLYAGEQQFGYPMSETVWLCGLFYVTGRSITTRAAEPLPFPRARTAVTHHPIELHLAGLQDSPQWLTEAVPAGVRLSSRNTSPVYQYR